MSDLPQGWIESRLSDLSETATSWNPKDHRGEFDYIDIEAIDNRNQRVDSAKRLAVSEAPSRARVRVSPGDVLFSLVRPYLKNIAIVPESETLLVASTAFCRVRPPKGVEPGFVYNFLRQERVISALKTYGNSPPAARDDEFFAQAIPLAPTEEQGRIVAKLDELFSDLDAGVAALQRARANLKRYRAAVLKAAVEGRLTAEWRAKHPPTETGAELLARLLHERRLRWEKSQLEKFEAAGKAPPKDWRSKYVEPAAPDIIKLPQLPDGWCWAGTEQLAEIQSGIQKQPKRTPRKNAVPYLRVGNVLRNRLDLDRLEKFELFDCELDRLRLKLGDLLVVEGNGSKTEIGRSAIWSDEVPDCVHQNHIIRVRFAEGVPEFYNAYWNSPVGKRSLLSVAASTSGLYTLSVSKVGLIALPLPPLDEQQKISECLDKVMSASGRQELDFERALARAASLRQSILKRAFAGKLVPQDPADEPASVLLDRIRAARAAAPASTRAPRKPKATRNHALPSRPTASASRPPAAAEGAKRKRGRPRRVAD